MQQSNATFQKQLAFGQIAETYIALWLRRCKGYSILPVYEKEIQNGKGPRFFTPERELVAPDMLVMRAGEIRWIEAKHKTVFSWYGKGGYWETGIDLHHYKQYLAVAEQHPWKVWLLFLHQSDCPDPRDIERWSAPPRCPTGLYGGSLDYLKTRISHTDPRWGRSGMVYWAHQTLKPLATLDEVRAAYAQDTVL